MTAKPRRRRVRIRGAILILFSKDEATEKSVVKAMAVFDNADENDANWPSTLTNLADAIEGAASDVQGNEPTSNDWSNIKGAIDDALEAYLNSES